MGSKKKTKWLNPKQAELLGLTPKPHEKGRYKARYRLTPEQEKELAQMKLVLNETGTTTSTSDYSSNTPKFVLSAWDVDTGLMMDLDTYCKKYGLPREDVSSSKLITHTGTPYWNIVFKEKISESMMSFDFESIAKKFVKPVNVVKYNSQVGAKKDFDTLTYTDVHIGMDTNPKGNSMYPVKWDAEEAFALVDEMVRVTLEEKESDTLVIDELGDFLDGLNKQTTRGGHGLPQNMTDEEAYNCAVEFKMRLADGFLGHYDKIIFNNICNDNHAGLFGYFANKYFKDLATERYKHANIEINNHRQFLNHYYVGDVCFVITHGKDESEVKFGFKVQADPKGIEKIDQYCKQNDIYRNASLIIFKKGDSHQALFDYCSSDDFWYFNYPAASPSSQWVQTNFKKGRRGFVNSSFKGLKHYQKPNFVK